MAGNFFVKYTHTIIDPIGNVISNESNVIQSKFKSGHAERYIANKKAELTDEHSIVRYNHDFLVAIRWDKNNKMIIDRYDVINSKGESTNYNQLVRDDQQ